MSESAAEKPRRFGRNKNLKRYTLDLEPDVMAGLKTLAARDESTVSYQVRKALNLHLRANLSESTSENADNVPTEGLVNRVARLERQVTRLTSLLEGKTPNLNII